MRKIYSFLLTLVLTCVSTVAWGYDVNITSDPENDYFSGEQLFDANELATALGLADAAAVQALIETNSAVYIKTGENEKSNAYSDPVNAPNVFWMNDQGVVQAYGDEGTCWYAEIYYNDGEENQENKDKVGVYLGQMPEFFSKVYTDTDLSCVLYLVNGDKTLTFNVSLHVNAAPEPTIILPEEVSLSSLEIVKDYPLPLNFILGKSYEGKTFSATLEGVYDALGVSAADLDAAVGKGHLSDAVYVQMIETKKDETTEETTSTYLDLLKSLNGAGTDGWFGRYTSYDETSGDETNMEINAPKGHGTGCTFFTQEPRLSEGEFSVKAGQFPGTFTSVEDADYTYLYLVYGTKAVRIKVQVAMEEPPTIDPDAMVEVGSTKIEVTAPINDSYTQKSFSIDMDAICEALGCTIDDIDDVYTMSNGSISNNHNEGSGGYYYNEEGVITNWGSSAAFFIGLSSLPEGKYGIGQMQGHFTNITEPVTCNAQLVFQYLQNYYSVYVEYTVTNNDDAIPQSEWTQEYEEEYTVQLVVTEATQSSESNTILNMKEIAEAIGTDDPTLWGEVWQKDDNGSQTKSFSNAYNINGRGFWMDSEGVSPGGWADNSAFGIEYLGDAFGYYVHYQTVYTAGQTFESNFYLVNEENGKYAKITLNVIYVDERTEIVDDEILGSQDVNIVLSADTYNDDNGQYYSPVVDWATAFTTLNMDPQDFEGAIWKVQKKADKFVDFGGTSEFDQETGTMDAKGNYVTDGEQAVFAVGLNISDGPASPTDLKFNMSLFGNDPEEGVVYATKVALKSDQGIYVFNIVGATEETMTGIKGTTAVKKAGIKFFDFSGREIPAPAKGYAIGTDGKKYYFNK